MSRGRRRADWMPICRLLNLIDARVRFGLTTRPLEPVEWLPDDLRDGMPGPRTKSRVKVTKGELSDRMRGMPGCVT